MDFFFFFFSPVLKVVENLGVSYVRSSESYKTKLESELRRLKFPYKVSKNKKKGTLLRFASLRHSKILDKSTGDEILFLKLKFCHFVRDVVFL